SLTRIGIFEHFLDAKTVVATGNGQSIYAIGCIDLRSAGPVVIEAPGGVLGFIISLWQQPLVDVGPLGPDKGEGGRFLLLPPGYSEDVPEGYFAVRSDTFLIHWVLRGFVKDGKPDAAVASLKRMKIYPLAEQSDPPSMSFVDLSGRKAVLIPLGEDVEGLAYFGWMARFLQREPVREQDKVMLGMLAGLGIEKDKPFAPDARTRAILTKAARVGRAMTATLAYETRAPNKLRWPGYSRWEELLLSEHTDFVHPHYIELDARAGLYYQAVGASSKALSPWVGVGSKYAAAFKDSQGRWLIGSHRYRLRVPANPPAKEFWSVTVYDAETRSMIANDRDISGRDSYQSSLKANGDGSIDLYFAPSAPPGLQNNWIATQPGVGFFLYFRWYGPLEAYFDKSWRLPDVERM
ncbi:MAG TPA: DUF1254 domain-containing protein, partial [Polyangiaceae bacterium]|nr:DUF1254 domain-containing protein [Polyangiaceae bacterium]